MGEKSASEPAFFNPHGLVGFVLFVIGLLLALLGFGALPDASVLAQAPNANQRPGMQGIASYRNDVSPTLRAVLAIDRIKFKSRRGSEFETVLSPQLFVSGIARGRYYDPLRFQTRGCASPFQRGSESGSKTQFAGREILSS